MALQFTLTRALRLRELRLWIARGEPALERLALRGEHAIKPVLAKVGCIASPLVLVPRLIVQHPVEQVLHAIIQTRVHQSLQAFAPRVRVPVLAELTDDQSGTLFSRQSAVTNEVGGPVDTLADSGSIHVPPDGPPRAVGEQVNASQSRSRFHQPRRLAGEAGHDGELERGEDLARQSQRLGPIPPIQNAVQSRLVVFRA